MVIGNFEGVGRFQKPKFEGKYAAKPEFPEGLGEGGFKPKTIPGGGMDIFLFVTIGVVD